MNIERNFKQPTVWSKHEADNGNIWYIPLDVDNKADHVHVSTSNKNGYGGRSLEFKLEDNTTDLVAGVWHGNAQALLKDTGIDLRDTHYTKFVAYSNEEEPDSIVYETEWELGEFSKNPDEDVIKSLKGKGLLYTSHSAGGSISGSVDIHL